jgi:hypothetical protein
VSARELAILRDRVARLRLEAETRAGRDALKDAFSQPELHSLWGYMHHRCRCKVCTAANTAHKARWRARRRARGVPTEYEIAKAAA